MILLVVGVVAVIVVILIAVFLSIRLGRSDEHDDPETARHGSGQGRARYESHRPPRGAAGDFPSGDYPPGRFLPEEFGNADYPDDLPVAAASDYDDYPSGEFESPRGGGRRGADSGRGRS